MDISQENSSGMRERFIVLTRRLSTIGGNRLEENALHAQMPERERGILGPTPFTVTVLELGIAL